MSLTTLMSSLAWYCLQGYTYLQMWYFQYFCSEEKKDNNCTNLPFNIIERNGLSQVYYPKLEQANYSFLQVQIEIDGEKHEVDAKSFMVIGNRLFDRPFTSWLIREIHDIELPDDKHYLVHIMDHEVNIIKLSPKEYIEVNKDNYLKKSLED